MAFEGSTRAQLQTLSVAELREIAKTQGIKYVMKYKKADLIDEILSVASSRQASEESAKQKQEEFVKSQPETLIQQEPETSVKQEPAASVRETSKKLSRESSNEISQPVARTVVQEITKGTKQFQNDSETSARRTMQGDGPEEERKRTHVYYNGGQPGIKREIGELMEEQAKRAEGILEVMSEGFGFIRCENFLSGENDVYVSPSQIRRFRLKTGDLLAGEARQKNLNEKFGALVRVTHINEMPVELVSSRPAFEDLTPIFPNRRLRMETNSENMAMRIVDLVSPIGMGQRGMIVSPPKAGKTTLLKEVAKSIQKNNPQVHMIVLLIDERPEEVTDIKEAIIGENVEVIYSTFDELPEHHKRVSEMVIERAKRLVELKKDVVILLDSITRLARAYNMTIPPSGRTLSGGLDPAALHMPKRFFGAARNMREGGSLTILATALVDTGSKMDDVVYEEFKGTGNMELVLNRKLSEKRVFPAIDILKSGTRREDLLLDHDELEAAELMRKYTNEMRPEDAVEKIMDLFAKTSNNREFVNSVKKYLQ